MEENFYFVVGNALSGELDLFDIKAKDLEEAWAIYDEELDDLHNSVIHATKEDLRAFAITTLDKLENGKE